MTTNSSQTYFAAQDKQEAAEIVLKKASFYYDTIAKNGFLEIVKKSWAAYHGVYFEEGTHKISFTGEQGELVQLPVNHYRNLCTHLLNMTTSNRPAMETRAVNSDYKSYIQTILANGLLEYYVREKRLERYFKRACEYAIVLGEGYVKLEWDEALGDEHAPNPETGEIIRKGDLRFSNLSVLDVIKDGSTETSDVDWYITRTWKNKFDLAAKYPELADNILKAQEKSELNSFGIWMNGPAADNTTLIPVIEFFHSKTASVPEGRYMMMTSSEAIMYDGPLPYRNIPLFRISESDILGTPFGYSHMWDLLPIQEVLNSLYSAVATNQNAFAIQNILVPKGSDLISTQIAGALNIIEYTASGGPGQEPKPLQLCATPQEVFTMIGNLEKLMETLSGINSVARGNPEANLESGTALALIQAQAIQFVGGLQNSYVQLLEDTGTSLIKILRDYAQVPRMAAIVGKSNRTRLKEFVGDDLDLVERVIVDVANPMSKTIAGRTQMADNLLKYGEITTTEYVSIIRTGQLDDVLDKKTRQDLLIKNENEMLTEGSPVQAIATDQHVQHIEGHEDVLSDPILRQDPTLVQNVLAHIAEHINLLQTTSPHILMALKQQPIQPSLPPGMEPPPGQGQPPGGPAPGAQPMDSSEQASPAPADQPNQPGLPQPAEAPTEINGQPLTPDQTQ